MQIIRVASAQQKNGVRQFAFTSNEGLRGIDRKYSTKYSYLHESASICGDLLIRLSSNDRATTPNATTVGGVNMLQSLSGRFDWLGASCDKWPALFKGRHFEAEIIILCVRWHLRYALSLRNLEESWRNGTSKSLTRRFGAGFNVSFRHARPIVRMFLMMLRSRQDCDRVWAGNDGLALIRTVLAGSADTAFPTSHQSSAMPFRSDRSLIVL
jgi:hypothetical protein